MPRHIVAIDQGTTGTTVLVLSEQLNIVSRGYREFPQIYPRPGWVEHDPEAIWASVMDALEEALAGAGCQPGEIAAIGITNQRETSLCFDRTGRPLHNAIVWQDRRTQEACQALRQAGHEPFLRERTGLLCDPYFSGTKFAWMLAHVPGLSERVARGEALFGTVDTFLVYRLTGGGRHATDVTNASRTLLFDLHELGFTEELCGRLGVPMKALPEVVPSQGVVGQTCGVPGLPDGIPIAGIAGDQQAALFGQLCFATGEAKCTYGTGAFLLVNIGARPKLSANGLVTTVAWQRPPRDRGAPAEVRYALEGSAFIAGAMVQWLRDGLGLIQEASEIEALARQVEDSGGVTCVPALAGLGAPHWRPEARGLISGITRGTSAAHLCYAALEGIALQNCDLLHAMEKDAGIRLTTLKVDGGAAQNDLLMQLQADLLGVTLVRPRCLEVTALGAALLAGLGVGLWTEEEVARTFRADRRFEPSMDRAEAARRRARWAEAVAKA